MELMYFASINTAKKCQNKEHIFTEKGSPEQVSGKF